MGRMLLAVAAVLVLAGCGGSDKPPPPAPLPPTSAPASIEPSDDDPFATTEPSAQVTEEEDPEPSAAPGDLSDEAQAMLDEAVGTELGALEAAPPAEAAKRRANLEKLPEEPAKVVAALRDYEWYSPQAKALYQKAISS